MVKYAFVTIVLHDKGNILVFNNTSNVCILFDLFDVLHYNKKKGVEMKDESILEYIVFVNVILFQLSSRGG